MHCDYLYSLTISPPCKYGLKPQDKNRRLSGFYYSIEHSKENKIVLSIIVSLHVASAVRSQTFQEGY